MLPARAKLPELDNGRARDKAAARWVEYFTVEAKKRQLSGLRQNQEATSVRAKLPERDNGRARAAVAARWVEFFAAEAKKRQVENGRFRASVNNGLNQQSVAKLPHSELGKAREKAAAMFNVSPRSVAT